MSSAAFGPLIQERRASLFARWRKKVLAIYPADSARFYASERNPFANPVGQTIVENSERLLDLLLDEGTVDEVRAALDPIIRIRAVQELAPSLALAFVPALKRALREEMQDLLADPVILRGLVDLDARVDDFLFVAFDLYMRCREEVATIRVREASRHVSGLLRRLGIANWAEMEKPPGCAPVPPLRE
jgi:hypothetical protein